MIKYKMGKDSNGNSIVTISKPGSREKGFSIQTNGNLPITHETREPQHIEISNYIEQYGTEYQKRFVYLIA